MFFVFSINFKLRSIFCKWKNFVGMRISTSFEAKISPLRSKKTTSTTPYYEGGADKLSRDQREGGPSAIERAHIPTVL
jgi:hypothetical protein